MLNLLISVACSALTAAIMSRFVTTNTWIILAASTAIFLALFFLITRTIMKKSVI